MPPPQVFVSYSHRNRKALDQFARFLAPLERDGVVHAWDDREIEGGDDWRARIAQQIDAARVAVLFISQDFLSSQFIATEELPRLLAREDAGELRVLPVFLSPSAVTTTEFAFVDRRGQQRRSRLDRGQGYGTPQKPLSDFDWSERERIYLKLSEDIRKLAGQQGAAATTSDAPAQLLRSEHRATRRASDDERGTARAYQLTVHFTVRGDDLETRYYLPGTDAIATTSRRWSDLAGPLAAFARRIDESRAASIDELLAKETASVGAQLFELVFGSDAQWEPVLRTLFDRPPSSPRANPTWAPVQLRVCSEQALLLGLPWALLAWQGTPLLDRDWQFCTCSELDPLDNPHTPAPASVLIIAPHCAAPSDEPAAAVPHVQAIGEVLQKAWPSARQQDYLRVVRTRNEVANALRGMRPHLIYIRAPASTRGQQPGLLLDVLNDAGRTDWLSLEELAALCRSTVPPPQVIYLDVHGLGSVEATPVAGLANATSLLIWRRLPEWQPDSTTQACAWLHRWLCDGEDPIRALPRADGKGRSAEALTIAVHDRYRNWTTARALRGSASDLPRLTLDRDEQKALVVRHVNELASSDKWRVMALVAYADRGNLLGSLAEQLQHELERDEAKAACNWRHLQFPGERENLRRDLEAELRLQLGADPGEMEKHLLRRHAPNVKGSGKRAIVCLDWGVFGETSAGQPPLTSSHLRCWLEFCSQFLGAHCPDDLRVVCLLAIETPLSKHAGLNRALETFLGEPWCTSERFRLDPLPPLTSVSFRHLLNYLVDKPSGCDAAIRPEVARLLVERTGGDFAHVVELIEEAQRGSWYDLRRRLRGEAVAASPADDEIL